MNCHFCGDRLELVQQFAYLVETQTVDNPAMLAAIRRLPHDHGRPLASCRACTADAPRREIAGAIGRFHAGSHTSGKLLWFSAVLLLGLAFVGREECVK